MRKIIVIFIALLLSTAFVSPARGLSLGSTEVIFKKGNDNWVKLKKGNPELFPFDHPHKFTPGDVKKALKALRYFRPGPLAVTKKEGKEYDLFTKEEIQTLAKPVSEAFSQASSGKWVDFSVLSFRGQSFTGSFRKTDGVMFVRDGKLNLALRNIAVKKIPDKEFSRYDPTKGYRSFTKMVKTPGVELKDVNWVTVGPENLSGAGQEALQEKQEEPEQEKVEKAEDEGDAEKEQEIEQVEEKAEESEGPSSEKSIKERLIKLKELYDEGLITEDEYRNKKEEILEEL